MKKFFAYTLLSGAIMTMVSSCSQEVEPALPSAGDQVAATFQLNLPVEEATRSFGDGTKALQLTYVFYEKNATTGALSIVGTADSSKVFENLKTTVNVNLVSGKSYTMVCWAQDAACTAYTFTAPADAAPTVDVAYDGVLQNDENRDAFYAAYDFTVTGPLSETVTLYRPFAQINVGTSDLDEASVVTSFGADAAKLRTTLSTKAYTNLNLISGAVSGQEEVNFGLAGIPSRTDEEFPYMPETYGYLSMDYILVPADKSLVDVTFNVYSTDDETTALNTVNVTDAPVQRNYRTNIFGQMLTTTGEFNVIIEPAFNEPPYNVEVEVKTPEQFVAALKENAKVVVPEGASIDLSNYNPGHKVELPNGCEVKVDGTLNAGYFNVMVKDGNKATVSGSGKIISVGEKGNFALSVLENSTLVVRDVTVETSQNQSGSSIYSDNGNLELENVTINSHFYAIGANGGTVKANKCVISSDSNNSFGQWAYAISIYPNDGEPCVAEFTDCTVNGIQGGFATRGEGTLLTLNDCTVTIKNYNGIAGTAFWPIYATDKSQVIVNSGKYYTENAGGWGALAGDNDTNMPAGNYILKGGEFCGKVYNTSTGEIVKPAAGYDYKAIEGNDLYKWEVVAE